jgi:hypothetical protein
MSLVDRWLSRSLPEERVATSATSATLRQDTSISVCRNRVATRCDITDSPTSPTPVSQPVADGLRHGNPQDAAVLAPLSQMS